MESLLRKALEKEISAFNADESKTSLPAEFSAIGFEYETVRFIAGEKPLAEVSISGPNDVIAVFKAVGSLSE
ncbi:MAG: hypothetical protein AAGJ87_04950 [Pseudomonadota bacterium]